IAAAEPSAITITSPQSYQVFQRIGYVPPNPAATRDTGSAEANQLGAAEVLVAGTLPEGWTTGELKYRVVPTAAGRPSALDDDAASESRDNGGTEWTSLPKLLTRAGSDFQFKLTVPAGGWYRLELQSRAPGSDALATGVVEPFGVGEVFIVAGQSYATNTNDEQMQVADAEQRIVAFDTSNNTWRVANDP